MWRWIILGGLTGLGVAASMSEEEDQEQRDAVEEPQETAGRGSGEGATSSDSTASEQPTTPTDDPGPAPEPGSPERAALEAGESARQRWEQEVDRLDTGAVTQSAKNREGRQEAPEAETTEQE